MKKITLLFLAVIAFALLQAQDQHATRFLFGNNGLESGVEGAWSWDQGIEGTEIASGVYQWKFKAVANAQIYFKFGKSSNANGNGFWVANDGNDMEYTGAGAMWRAYYRENMGDGGAITMWVQQNHYYIIQARKQFEHQNDHTNFAVFESELPFEKPVSVSHSLNSPDNLAVTVTLNQAPNPLQKFWVRYTKDSWGTSAFVEAVMVDEGIKRTAELQVQANDEIQYYVFTTVQAPEDFTDYDFFAVYIENQGGSNYVFYGPMSGDFYIPNVPSGAKGFTSLSAAATQVNLAGLAGHVNFLINGDVNETENIGLINKSDYTLTIRPDGEGLRTITFNKASDNAGPSGALCIGIGMGLKWADLMPTKNMVIDGYVEGGSERQLKIATADTHHGGNGPIVILNGCSNIQIVNTIIEHKGTNKTGYGIYLRCDTRYGSKNMPSDVLIGNNHITVTKHGAYQGIGIYGGGGTPAAPEAKATGVLIRKNIIHARTRGVFLNYVKGIEIVENEFNVEQTSAGMLSSAIMGSSGLEGDIKVERNNFKNLVTYNSNPGDYGMKGIIASGGGTWYIHNNFFGGLDKGSGAGSCMLQAIRCGSPCVIRHNTFYLKSLTQKPADNPANPNANDPSYCAINIAAGTPEIKNNIFVSEESEVYNFLIRGTNGGDSDYNVFYFATGNEKAYINGTHQTLAAYREANPGKDVNSKFAAVTFADAAQGDLSIAGESIKDIKLRVPSLVAVVDDIFGNTRASDFTYAGAHESELPFPPITDVDEEMIAGDFLLKQTAFGIEVELPHTADVELYTINGQLIDKTRTSGVYSRELGNGMYIIRVNGKAQKFAR